MDTITPAVSPLRQRMTEDMRMRKLEPRTQEAYIRAVRKLTEFLKRSPDTATVEDLRNFQLHLVDTGTSPITLNATLTGLKFFFDITLGRGELLTQGCDLGCGVGQGVGVELLRALEVVALDLEVDGPGHGRSSSGGPDWSSDPGCHSPPAASTLHRCVKTPRIRWSSSESMECRRSRGPTR